MTTVQRLSFSCLLILFLSLRSSCLESISRSLTAELSPIIVQAKYGEHYTYILNKTVSYIFQYNADMSKNISLWPARISVKSDLADNSSPILVVVRKQRSVYSWQIPYTVETKKSFYQYDEASRTICPDILNQETDQDMIISISSASPYNFSFSLVTYLSHDFVVRLSDQRHLMASPSEPIFYNFQFDHMTESVLLVVESSDELCMTLSVQNISCPVVDLERNVQYRGGMLLKKSDFPLGLFIVFVVHSDDYDCSGHKGSFQFKRNKAISFSIEKNISDENYLIASLALLSIFAGIYVVAFFIGIKCIRCCPSMYIPSPADILSPEEPTVSTISPIAEIAVTRAWHSSDSSLDETDIDFLHDRDNDKDVFRTKTFLFVSDLSRKEHRVLSAKAQLYFWNLITVAIFYSLPVVQLVLNDSGNEDMCYYNYLCSHPFWNLSDINHIFSNIGYVFLGFLFILITVNRERASLPNNKRYGIPHHFGFFYSMGMALIMEGVLSACYHVCPSHSNFQFDTSFMYVIAMLSLLKIYQSRHPDINATAYSTFVALAFVIFVGMVGVLDETFNFYVIFTVIHVLVCMVLSAQIYYMGRWKLDARVFHRVCGVCIADIRSGPRHCCRPMYPSRLVLLIFGNLFNWALAAAQLRYHMVNFGTYFLAVFMVNLCLYLMFYITMKYLSGEKIMAHTGLYLAASILLWTGALYFFFNKSISWAGTPAESRTYNRPCLVLNFYDHHDVWHVLSALAMFFSFMCLLALDDDVSNRDRDTLPVF
ncbi:hypothetical protein M8J76_010178 [Diaphorina citri]|nr:hypothetical protein M8J76_010178 [Diaphorina citri]